MYAKDQDADLVVVGASTRGQLAKRVFGDVAPELVQRSRRPVLVVSAPSGSESRISVKLVIAVGDAAARSQQFLVGVRSLIDSADEVMVIAPSLAAPP